MSARGIILQKQGEKLIIQASDADVVQFALGAHVNVSAQQLVPESVFPASAAHAVARINALMEHGFVYDRHGQPIGYVTECQTRHEPIDVTTFADAGETYVPGLLRYTIHAEGPL